MSNIPKQIFPIFNYSDFNQLTDLTSVENAINNDPNFGSDVYSSINSNTTSLNNLKSHYNYTGNSGVCNFDSSGNFTISNNGGSHFYR